MGYHLTKILKGTLGEISKVEEELREYIDAKQQGCIIMQELELADMYGALEAVAKSHNLTMDDLRIMSDITKRAFEDGTRK